ncbi:DUF5047 domain-containing protein [Streptomyces sp. NPDC002491]
MYAVSAKFLRTLATSHTMIARVDAYYGGLLTASAIPFTSGSVTVDRGSKTRRSLSLTVADPAYLPWDATDKLAAYGQQLVVSRGIRYSDGSEEWVPLGTFRINSPAGDVHFGPVSVTGASLECAISDDKFAVPATNRGMGGCADVIAAFIHETIPTATVVNLTAGARNPTIAVANWDVGTDRWDVVSQLATAMQAEVYVDAQNRFVIADIPDLETGTVAWDIAEGEGGTLISSARAMSRTAVFNAVLASGENTAAGSAPVSAIAKDTDPTSPTLWGGPFGKVTKTISSALWTTVGACQAAAEYALFDAIAPSIQESIDALPNPALEGNDIIRIIRAGRKERALVQSVVVPLTPAEDFSLTLRGSKEDAP